MSATSAFAKRVGPHGSHAGSLASLFSATDELCVCSAPFRDLRPLEKKDLVQKLQDAIKTHHASPEELARYEKRKALAKKIGLRKPFPSFEKTKRGNLAEIVLADYLAEITKALLPVYRLRYNPNVEQSMKGDDVLIFSLSSRKKRIFLGEAKFRSTPNSNAVKDICEALVRSAKGGLPISIPFVVNRLYESGQNELAEQIDSLGDLFAEEKVEVIYVGFLLGGDKASDFVKNAATNSTETNPCMLALEVDGAADLVDECFHGL